MSYDEFAGCYDFLTINVGYKARTAFLLSLFERYDRRPKLLLDMACGTAEFSTLFAKENIEVIGVDPSCAMLSVAREKICEAQVDVLLLCQKASELELYGTVDGAVCCLDSLNHITDYDELIASFKRISLFLEPQRLFIFDLNTIYKHKEVLSGQTFIYDTDEVYCVWQNSKCDENGLVNIDLDFFIPNEQDLYCRSSESFCERAYNKEQIAVCLKKSRLEVVAILGDMSYSEPSEMEERVIYVTRKV
ncbi:MAG: class I SAM-dependent methyltransferase [Oscillospiraceae bacterium]|nr:class I SAM-dependent methyltransferase [Oscillospiraceae bacterium]